jgi:hypothetical protein
MELLGLDLLQVNSCTVDYVRTELAPSFSSSQAADGREYILEVNSSSIGLTPRHQQEGSVVEFHEILNKMSNISKTINHGRGIMLNLLEGRSVLLSNDSRLPLPRLAAHCRGGDVKAGFCQRCIARC